jgi:hypothetical protein
VTTPTTADRRPAARRANTLVLVTAILVLLVILATAFLVRSQSGRAQAAAEQKATGREHRVEAVAAEIAQHVADALFVRRIDPSSLPAQVADNQATGLAGQPIFGEFLARSDYPRLPPEPLAVRYGVDYVDTVNNVSLAAAAGGDGFIDGYNYAPFATFPFTNWPARYRGIPGEGNPNGNPGFGDTRWLASTEPVRALTVSQAGGSVANPNWSNLALFPVDAAAPGSGVAPRLSPEGLGFSHWAHLSWIATADNGFRLCWDISDVEANWDHLTVANPSPQQRAVAGELNLGVPYEQWLPYVPPREPRLLGKDARGYLVLDPNDWLSRRNQWFNVGIGAFDAANPPPHQAISTGVPNAARRFDALPNFLQLSAFGTPADEFKVVTGPQPGVPTGAYPVGSPTPRSLIARTLADADGDGWTDSFWFVAPTSSDRSTRQLVAVRIMDNSALLNVNVASRFERTNTIGQTPADLALATRRESYADVGPTATFGRLAAWWDPPVGFLNSPDNDPEFRVGGLPPYVPAQQPPAAQPIVYRDLDVGFLPARWEGARTQPAATAAPSVQPTVAGLLGLVTEAAPGKRSVPIPLFDATAEFGLGASTSPYGDSFLLSRAADRLTYFKAMANNGELLDPITAARIATLTPFGADDEIELRSANGLNSPQTVSRLESALSAGLVAGGAGGPVDRGASAPIADGTAVSGQFLRSSRSREETSRFLPPGDPRVQDWRARNAWNDPNAPIAARSGVELLLDHRRKLTTVSGARNEMLPPRLWTLVDHSNLGTELDVTRTSAAFIRRGVDFNGDGAPDDVTGDGVVDLRDDLVPYHPNIMFPAAAFIPPGGNNPFGLPVRDTNGDGRIDVSDFENARQRFLVDNRKIDLRRPNDATANGLPATPVQVAAADRAFAIDMQRMMRRALIYEEGDRPTHSSYFGRPGDNPADREAAVLQTRMMTASMAANVLSWRDGLRRVTNTLYLDQPLHPQEAIRVPPDAIPPTNPALQAAGFIGVEKQPFLMEVFIAFVYPKTELSQAQIDAVATGVPPCPPAAACQLGADNYSLPPCTINGAGEHIVTFDPANPDTQPAVVFVAQVANPWNTPVNLADFELRINPANGAPQRFFFGVPDPAGGVSRSGNIYGPDVQLGPCTPEEPRTAIVFAIPSTFPNGDPFPRQAWLDYLDIGAPIDADGDGVISAVEANLADDPQPGQPFVPDANAIFEPAWGGPTFGTNTFETQFARRGTLYFDATRTATFPGLDPRAGVNRWTPSQSLGGTPPNSSFIELRRAIYPSLGGAPTWTVVDRFENELDPAQGGQNGQRFVDRVNRLLAAGPGGSLPPPLQINCRPGGLAIDGIRIRGGDMFVAWARGGRQWLFDTQAGQPGTPPGRGVISMDERTPRYAFARSTGTASVERVVQDVFVGGVQEPQGRTGDIMSFESPPDRAYDGNAQYLRWPTAMQYFNVWGEPRRGKPTFLPTRIPEFNGQRTYAYPAWRIAPGTALSSLGIGNISYGEKAVTDARFVNGTDHRNFVAPMRLFQKDADFDHVAEILDVPMWGPLVAMDATGRTFATFPEILAQPASSRGTANVFFPKFTPQSPMTGLQLPDFGPDQVGYNRLGLEPAQFDTVANPNGRPNMISGVQVLPPLFDPVDPSDPVASLPRQNGSGFNSRLPGGVVLLDAFTVDDRGARPFDSFSTTAPPDGVIDFAERAAAEDRRLRLARNFEGKLTPGLININTAPIEVMRAMPHMTRLVYDDDYPIALTQQSDPSRRYSATEVLGLRRTLRDTLNLPLWQDGPADLAQNNPSPLPGVPAPVTPIVFDDGIPAPRVRLPEAIDLWRSKLNVDPGSLVPGVIPSMPSYFTRGADLQPVALNHREWAPGMRQERGFDSLGELALITRGAEFVPGTAGDLDGNGVPDVQEIATNRAQDLNRNGVPDGVDPFGLVGDSWNRALSWSSKFAGLDPYRTSWRFPAAGGGTLAAVDPNVPTPGTVGAGTLAYRTEGIPAALPNGTPQRFPLTGRTAIDKHLLTVSRDNRLTGGVIETDDPATTDVVEAEQFRHDQTATDALERNSLLKGISNIATVRSDVFTVWVRIRTIRQDPLTGRWPGMDPEYIVDDSRYMMTVDRSSVDRPGEAPRILSFVKVPN